MRHVALLAAFVLVVSGAAAPVANAATPTPVAAAVDGAVADAGAERTALAPADVPRSLTVGAPLTNFTVALRTDGTARWTVATRIPLADDADREAFREYAEAYEAGAAAGGPDVAAFRNAAGSASKATGREMSIGEVNRSATLANGSGVLRLRFTWTNFLEETDDGELVLGDAFRTPDGGTWFGSLSASQRLVIEPPEGYGVSDVSQGFSYSIDDRRIVADGPQRFEAGDIEVAYTPGPTRQGVPLSLLAAGAGVAVLLVAAYLVYRLRRRGPDLDAAGAADPGGADSAAGGSSAAPDADRGTAGDAGTDAAVADADAGATAGDDPTGAAGSPGSAPAAGGAGADGAPGSGELEEDLELLSDEERVERLLEGHGGRMRQANIVAETGWSDAKVSQLLSAMADAGRVEKLRLGRENLISLADGVADGDGSGGPDTAGDAGDADDAAGEGFGDGAPGGNGAGR